MRSIHKMSKFIYFLFYQEKKNLLIFKKKNWTWIKTKVICKSKWAL